MAQTRRKRWCATKEDLPNLCMNFIKGNNRIAALIATVFVSRFDEKDRHLTFNTMTKEWLANCLTQEEGDVDAQQLVLNKLNSS